MQEWSLISLQIAIRITNVGRFFSFWKKKKEVVAFSVQWSRSQGPVIGRLYPLLLQLVELQQARVIIEDYNVFYL